MTLLASGCDQCLRPVGVFTVCGQWVVTDLLDYLIMKYPYCSCGCTIWQAHPYIMFNFCFIPALVITGGFLRSPKEMNILFFLQSTIAIVIIYTYM